MHFFFWWFTQQIAFLPVSSHTKTNIIRAGFFVLSTWRYMLIMSILFFLLTGSIGLLSSFSFATCRSLTREFGEFGG